MSGTILVVVFLCLFAALLVSDSVDQGRFPDLAYCWTKGLILLAAMLILWLLQALLLKKIDNIFTERNGRLRRIVDATSHELKTPLTLTMANLDLLEMENGSDELIDDMRDEAQHMTHLVQKMVELSHHEEGEWMLTFKRVDVSGLVSQCIDDFRPKVELRDLGLFYEGDADITCYLDEGELKQIMFVLLDNAVKYCDDGGTIAVRLRATGPLHAEIRVENTYAEVDSAEFHEMFDRFYRGKRAQQTASGDGLGLSIARLAAKKLGGTIEVYERRDVGAIGFVVSI